MAQSYHMVIYSLFFSCLLLVLLFVYRYVFPRKKLNLLFVLLLVSFLPLISVLRMGVYESGDFNLHIYRAMAFYSNLQIGQFYPSWAGELNATFGYPLFVFINPLPYYLISLFHFFGFSFVLSMKLFLIMSFMLSGVGMYWWIREQFHHTLAAFTAGVFYLFAPYHLVDQSFRVDVGEIAAFAIIPFLLWFVLRFFNKRCFSDGLVVALLFALLLFAHQATALFSLSIIGAYLLLLFFQQKKRSVRFLLLGLLSFGCCFGFGLLLSLPAWLPYITLTQYTLLSHLAHTVSFLSASELLYSKWRYGLLFQGPQGQLAYLIGYTELVVILFSALFVFVKRQSPFFMYRVFWLALVAVYIFFMTPSSNFFWQTIPLIRVAALSSRILLFVSICTAVLAGMLVMDLEKKKLLIFLLLFFTIGSTVLNWGNRRVIASMNDTSLRAELWKSTAEGEGLSYLGTPKWQGTMYWRGTLSKHHAEVLQGKAEIHEIARGSVLHRYTIVAKNRVVIKENTLYFPGWTVSDTHHTLPINYQNPSFPGLITFVLPTGTHYIEVRYQDPLFLALAKYVSLGLFLGSLIVLVFLHSPYLRKWHL